MKSGTRRGGWRGVLHLAVAVASLTGGIVAAREDEDDGPTSWVEVESPLPTNSRLVRPIPVDLGPASDNQLSIDAHSLTVGSDGVVRFVAAVKSAGGVTSVSFEGIRCSTRERRSYAFGRPDGSWVPARGRWQPLDGRPASRFASVLFREFFCPAGLPVRSAVEAVRVLEQGGRTDGAPQ